MEILIDNLAKDYLHRLDVDESTPDLVGFQLDEVAASAGTHSSATCGQIFYKTDQEDRLTERVFVKFRVADSAAYDVDVRLLFENEIHFYEKVRPFLHAVRSIDHLVPQFLAAAKDSKADGPAIMLRLLGPEWVGHNYQAFMDYGHMSLMATKLGEFHAYSFAARRRDAEGFARLANVSANMLACALPVYGDKMAAILRRGLRPLRADTRYCKGVARADSILRGFAAHVTRSYSKRPQDKYYVLGHLSYMQSNVLFRYDGPNPVDMKILDWQTASFLSLGVDLIVTLYVDIGQRARDLYWDRLLDDYHQALCGTFDNCNTPSREEVLQEMKRSVCAAFFMIAYRVLRMNGKDGCNSHPIWNDQLITEMFRDLIDRDLL